MTPLIATRAATLRYIAALAALCALLSRSAYASSTDCDASGASLPCRLTSLLHWLDAAAIVLVVVLLVVIGIAIYLYRKNRADGPRPR